MEVGNLQKLLLIGVISGMFVYIGGWWYLDFANTFGFSNETDTLFTNFIDYDEVNQTIANFESQSQQPSQDAGLIQYLANLGQLIFGGVYTAIKSLFGLTNTLTELAANGLVLMGIPEPFKYYVFGAITIMVVSTLLIAVGVIRRG
jgi:hypothetical protein